MVVTQSIANHYLAQTWFIFFSLLLNVSSGKKVKAFIINTKTGKEPAFNYRIELILQYTIPKFLSIGIYCVWVIWFRYFSYCTRKLYIEFPAGCSNTNHQAGLFINEYFVNFGGTTLSNGLAQHLSCKRFIYLNIWKQIRINTNAKYVFKLDELP